MLAAISRPVLSSCRCRRPAGPRGGGPGDIDVLAADHALNAGRGGQLARGRQQPLRRRACCATAAAGTPRRTARRRPGSRRPRRTSGGRSAARGAGRRRPSPAGRRGSASRCGSARSPRPAAARRRGRAAERRSGGQRQHRPDPLAAREQRVAHRLVKPGCRGLVGEAQRLEVPLDLGAQVVGVRGTTDERRPSVRPTRGRTGGTMWPSCDRARPSQPPAAGAAREGRAAARARLGPARRPAGGLGGQPRAFLDQAPAPRPGSSSPARSRSTASFEPLAQLGQGIGHAQ